MPPQQRAFGGQGDGFEVVPGNVINGRYRVESEAGRGNFARVLRARDAKTNQMIAVKILRSTYARDAQFELEVLQAIARKDPRDTHRVCKIKEHFTWGGCPCFVFPLYGPSLKSRQHYFGVPNRCSRDEVRLMAKTLSKALAFMHFECRMVHTDLKPENILCTRPDKPRGVGDCWTIVDFGSASFYSERPDKDLISTRPYRAPEVLVQTGWCYGADMWSLACILYEVYRGRMLFTANQDQDHLQQIEARLGTVPQWLVEQASPAARRLFDSAGRLPAGPIHGARPQPLQQELSGDPEFCDLMLRLLDYDPALRMRSDEVSHHPFCAGVPSLSGVDAPPLTRLPISGYSSQRIRSPGCAQLAAGMPRARPDRLLHGDTGSAGVTDQADRALQGNRGGGSAARRSLSAQHQAPLDAAAFAAALQRREQAARHPSEAFERVVVRMPSAASIASSGSLSAVSSAASSASGSSFAQYDRWSPAVRPASATTMQAAQESRYTQDSRLHRLPSPLARRGAAEQRSVSPCFSPSRPPPPLPGHAPAGTLPAYRTAPSAATFARHTDSARVGSWRDQATRQA
eukprot:TRINITY_DN1457_c0_g3_i1.p1 TRINITY_DN1457_c0_g3~~TRINITY_DN1457_c0_g3_i1.p1  ORF type:complete len:609 (+),score=135.15 TRINITY_DN1457_c0_g3_i1:111-1829(+)